MNRITLAASVLLLGSSAVALASQTEKAADSSAPVATLGAKPAMIEASTATPVGKPEFYAVENAAFEPKKIDALASIEGKPVYEGVGGPIESEEVKEVSSDANALPPCAPGPGDDRCIQLYEPGVRAQLASWKQDEKLAMGGPLEPVEQEAKLESASLEYETTLATAAVVDKPLEAHEAATGVGGPIEAAQDYPACSPGPGDDRCIQLYEPGVTGSAN